MKNKIVVCCLLAAAGGVVWAEKTARRPVETVSVPRCLFISKTGDQCPSPALQGQNYCSKHSGFSGNMKTAAKDVGNGASVAWQSTKTWSSNAWESTKSGVNRAWEATADAFDGARVGMVELFGGKDAKKSADKKPAKTK